MSTRPKHWFLLVLALILIIIWYVTYVTTRPPINFSMLEESEGLRSKGLNTNKFSNKCDSLDSIPFRHNGEKHIGFIFHHAEPHGHLERYLTKCLDSIFTKSSVPYSMFTIHIIGDVQSFNVAKDVLKELRLAHIVKLEHHDREHLVEKSSHLLRPILGSLGATNHRFSDPLYFISTVLHRFLQRSISQIILLDVDLVFKSDIAGLFKLFQEFSGPQVVGVAQENQPVYRHVFREYRQRNPNTKIGEAPPDGLAGVNSGVLLLDLDKMRCSETYNNMFMPGKVPSLVQKYLIQPNLGDQDFYTLLQFDSSELLYILPCGWNRQLCQWWRMDRLAQVFDLFYHCEEPIHVLHGNCKTSISKNEAIPNDVRSLT